MENSGAILLLLIYWVCSVNIDAQTSIGLKVSASHRGLVLGAGLPNPNLQNQEFFGKKQGVDQEILA